MPDLIVRQLNDMPVSQRPIDGYINATQLCKAAGKFVGNYLSNKETKEFLAELSSVIGKPITDLVQSIHGGIPTLQGTWIHPRVAYHLGQWCSPKAAVQVTEWLEELHTTGTVSLLPPPQSLIKQRIEDIEYVEGFLKRLGTLDDQDRIHFSALARQLLANGTDHALMAPMQDEATQRVPQPDFWTISMRLQSRKIIFSGAESQGAATALGLRMQKRYLATYKRKPSKRWDHVKGQMREVNLYAPDDLPMMDEVIDAYLTEKGRTP